jgi:ApaG protein
MGGFRGGTLAAPSLLSLKPIMPGLLSGLAPLSDAVTNDIRVEVLSLYSAENSVPLQDTWVFQYTVRITNQGASTVQLLSRHWTITDALEHVEEVEGPGVIGEQPVLRPGQSFKYSSWCPLKTPMGMMYGTYQMVGEDGTQFDIQIAPFALKAPYTVN